MGIFKMFQWNNQKWSERKGSLAAGLIGIMLNDKVVTRAAKEKIKTG